MLQQIKQLLKSLLRLSELEKKVDDIQIRTQDTQNRVYDALWQQKTLRYQQHVMLWQIYRRPDEDLMTTKLRFFRSLPKAEGNARKSQLVMLELLKKIHKVCKANSLQYWLDFGALLGAIRHGGFIPWDDDIDLGMMRKDAEKLCDILRNDAEVFVRFYYVNGRENGITRICQIKWAESPYGMYSGAIDIFLYDYCNVEPTAENWEYWKQKKEALRDDSKAYPEIRGALKNLIAGNTQELLCNAYESHFAEVREKLQIKTTETGYIVFGWDNLCYPYHDRHIFPKEKIFPLTRLEYEGEWFNVPREYFEYSMSMYGDIFTLPSDMLSHIHVDIQKHQKSLNYLFDKYVRCIERKE